jgi:meso-butanediol dehydrogenase / (S,S)-butanediol dehydrogenase / diacetyl reductase
MLHPGTMRTMSKTPHKHCLVTGGSSGIGFAVAERLRDDGWSVTSLSRRTIAPDGVRAVTGDAADDADLERAVEAASGTDGRLDGLVCAAGLPPSGPWDDPDHWAEIIRVDLTAAWQASRLAWSALRSAGGAIVLLGSIVGSGEGSTRSPAYAAAKAGIEGLGRSLALIGAKEGVRVNVLAPGAIDTPFDVALFPADDRPDVPLGRMGTAHEVAGVAAFLLSTQASYVSGAVWRVDGGRTVLSPASSAGTAAPEEHTQS